MANQHLSAPMPGAITDPDALFTETYTAYRGFVRSVILDKLGNGDTHLADDLTQDTFLALYRYRDRVDMTRDMGGMLRVMARQSISHHYRVKRNTCERPADPGAWRFANNNLAPAASGAYEPVRTGVRTAVIGGAR